VFIDDRMSDYIPRKKKLSYRRGTARRAMLANSCHAMFHEVWELERFQAAKVTYKVIGNFAIR